MNKVVSQLAELGFEFIPLKPGNSSNPYFRPDKWNKLGTNDLGQLEEWDQNPKYQGFAMVFKNQHAFCIDLDVNHKEGVNGINEWKKLNMPPPSIAIKTPSGGLHLIYKHPGFLIKGSTGWDPITGLVRQDNGIDIRADKNFIASFGVIRHDKGLNGKTYELHELSDLSKPLVELPQNVINNLPRADSYKAKETAASKAMKDTASLYEYEEVESPLHGQIPDIIREGERDDVITSLTASWARRGVPRELMVLGVHEAARRCETPPDFDVVEKVDSALGNPVVRYSYYSKDVELMLKGIVFLYGIGRYAFLYNKKPMTQASMKTMLGHLKTEVELKGKDKDGNQKTKMVPIFNLFDSSPSKITAHSIGYKPCNSDIYFDKVVNSDLLNAYDKPDVEAARDDALFEKLLKLSAEVTGDEEKGRILVEFVAFLVQNPGVKIGIALVIITRQGKGKGLFVEAVSQVLGMSNVAEISSANIESRFNDIVINKQLVIVNEASGNRDGTMYGKREARQAEARWKMLITDKTIPAEGKGKDVIQRLIYTNFLVFSNEVSAVPFGEDDRRHMCFVNNEPPRKESYYKEEFVKPLLCKEGASAILHGLETLEIKSIHANMVHINKTADDDEVLKGNLQGNEGQVYEDIQSNSLIFTSEIVSIELFKWYCVYRFGLDTKKDSVFIKRLMKKFYTPLHLNKKCKQAKQVMIPFINFTFNYRNGNEVFVPNKPSKDLHHLYIRTPNQFEELKIATDFELSELKEKVEISYRNFASSVDQSVSMLKEVPMHKPGLQEIKNLL